MPHIGVFCSSSNAIDSSYPPIAETLGAGIAHLGYTFVYGGGDVGLMGAAARSATENGGSVVGVIPRKLESREGLYTLADELIITDTMSERKQTIYDRSDAFVVLPGGYGTLEEFMEILTLRNLGYHGHPIILVNTDGFYDTLIQFFDELFDKHFARERAEEVVHIVPSAEKALELLASLD
ncbi:TIGR00730 family Rossman fold protein [Longibacter salinarum]|uniref:Cytokinin riboside 5'-monophosphate phosphoribohydrolase n=1 Tax=Longibacter salinarum TaxID=1850348 RepID=A0A2A8D0H5_9BACT|nr:TIGR00730 family Rossman fold protein [Longibacter salinarum]PEN14307.1 TIGR00730 family Rossman fold protein [Longibacter salinarum]